MNKEKNLKMTKNVIIVTRKIISHEIVDQRTKKINDRLMYWLKSLIKLRFKRKN